MAELARRLAVARGDEPADLVVRGGRVLSVFTREWLETDLAIADGFVAGLGDYKGVEEIDAAGSFVVPGFIDAHMHLESPKLLPDEFARLVSPLGTTAVVADPHELANVLGTDGVHWLLDFCAELPLDVYFMANRRCRLTLRVAASSTQRRRPAGPPPAAPRTRVGGDDEFPRGDSGRRGRADQARSDGCLARRRSRSGRRRQAVERLRGGRNPLRP
jgi:hypothetical protein